MALIRGMAAPFELRAYACAFALERGLHYHAAAALTFQVAAGGLTSCARLGHRSHRNPSFALGIESMWVIAQTTELGTRCAATSLASVMRYCDRPSTAKVRYFAYFSPIFRTCSYAGSFRHARTASTLGYS